MLVAHLQPDQQAGAAYVDNKVRAPFGDYPPEPGQYCLAERGRPFDQSLPRDRLDRGAGGGHGDRRRGERGGVHDRVAAERRVRGVRGDHRRDRYHPAAEALARQQDVGDHLFPVGTPPRTQAAEPGLDLVQYEQRPVRPAQPFDLGQVAGRRDDHAGFPLYRLDDHAALAPGQHR